jgi:hypothetical protein
MNTAKSSGRQFKKKIRELLSQRDFANSIEEICQLPAKQVISPLFSFFHSLDEMIKWRSITAMGVVVAGLAKHDMESARVVMRRLMWNLNNESGGIGWGSPEAMGEIMARHKGLAEEYCRILISYISEDKNYIEHEALQRGVLWGIGRLAHSRPHLLVEAAPLLVPFMASKDAVLRGLAAWAAAALDAEITRRPLKRLLTDNADIQIFLEGQLVEIPVSQLARQAMSGSARD